MIVATASGTIPCGLGVPPDFGTDSCGLGDPEAPGFLKRSIISSEWDCSRRFMTPRVREWIDPAGGDCFTRNRLEKRGKPTARQGKAAVRGSASVWLSVKPSEKVKAADPGGSAAFIGTPSRTRT